MTTLHTENRSASGTRASHNMRRAGRIPAVVYGEGGATVPISIDATAFHTLLRHHERVLDLEVAGEAQQVLIHQVQWDHLGDHLMHVDFLRASRGKKLRVEVELDFVGRPKGVPRGEFHKNIQHIEIFCTPRSIPEKVDVLIADLDVGDSIHVRDLVMPEGVTCTLDAEVLVCGVHARVEAEPEAGAVAGEESAEPEVIGKGKAAAEEEDE